MGKHFHRLTLVLLASLLTLSACSALATPVAQPLIPGLAQTLAAQTLTAQQGGWQASGAPISTQPPPAELPGEPIQPTSTPSPAETPIPLLTPQADSRLTGSSLQPSEPCTNAAEFIRDVSIPDNTMMKRGERFIKTWQFKNTGTCTWTPDYAVIFVWGERMGGASPKALGQTIAPGQIVEISTELQAPKETGGFQGSWIFQDPEGNQFGTGYEARNLFWVNITVVGKLDQFFGGKVGCIGGG
jgi:hypothetical protein